jgi:hypothetical protein
VKNEQKVNSRNELTIRLRQLKHSAGNISVGVDAGVRFRAFLFRHRTHIQDRHSSVNVQHNLLDKSSEPTVGTRKREKISSEIILETVYSPLKEGNSR